MNSDSRKVILIALAVVLSLCGLCGVVTVAGGALFTRTVARTGVFEGTLVGAGEEAFKDVVDAGRGIVTFDLPARFSDGGQSFRTNFAGFEMVGFTSGDEHSHLYLMQAPDWVNVEPEDLDRALAGLGQNPGQAEMRVTGKMEAEVRGTPTTFVVTEGVNRDGRTYRAVTGRFEGNSGTALLMYMTPVDSWDQAELESFLGSLR